MGRKRILIVEDDRLLANAYRIKLEEREFEVQISPDGKTALDIITFGIIPHLVILDILMPIMDGSEFLKRLREIDQCKQTPVLVATNLNKDVAEESCKNLGVYEYIVKTDYRLGEIVEKVMELIEDNYV